LTLLVDKRLAQGQAASQVKPLGRIVFALDRPRQFKARGVGNRDIHLRPPRELCILEFSALDLEACTRSGLERNLSLAFLVCERRKKL